MQGVIVQPTGKIAGLGRVDLRPHTFSLHTQLEDVTTVLPLYKNTVYKNLGIFLS
jgi:hypothetical protein